MLGKASLLTASLATTIAVAACGGSSPSSGSSTAAKTNADRALAMARCVRAHGVPKFPDPGSRLNMIQSSQNANGGGSVSADGVQLGVSAQTLQKAMSECGNHAPGGPPISGAQLAKLRRGALKMAECMRSHGVPRFPDPQVTTGAGGHGIRLTLGGDLGSSREFNPSSPAFQKAQRTCNGFVGAKATKVGR